MAIDPFGDPESQTVTQDPFGDPEQTQDKSKSSFLNNVTNSKASEINPLGVNMTSGMFGANPVEVAKGSLNTALGAIEGATAGIPRAIAEKISGKDLSDYRGNIAGQIIGFTAGPGKIATKAATSAEKALFGSAEAAGTRIAKATTKGFLGNSVKEGIKRGLVTGTVGGAVGGALFPQEDALNIGNRVVAAAIGGITGAPIGASFGGVSGFIKSKQALNSAKRVLEKLKKINNRGLGEGVSEGSTYQVSGNPQTKGFNPNVTPFEKVADKEIKTVKSNRDTKISFLQQQKESELSKIKQQYDVDEAILDGSRKELEGVLAESTDPKSVGAIKEAGKQWTKKTYEWYGNQIDDIANKMSDDGAVVFVDDVKDGLTNMLQEENLVGSELTKRLPTDDTERALLNWYKQIAGVEKDQSIIGEQFPLKDLLKRLSDVKATGNQRLINKTRNMVSEILSKTGNSDYVKQLSNANQKYRDFAPLRDFFENTFEPYAENVGKGRSALFKYAEGQNKTLADKTLDVDTIRQLEKLEKEIGIPFLSKLRAYGSKYELLEQQTANLKSMLEGGKDVAKQLVNDARSKAAQGIRLTRAEAQKQLEDITLKRARTRAVSDAIYNRLTGNLRTALDQIKVPENVSRQVLTAGYAYILTRVLGGVLSKKD